MTSALREVEFHTGVPDRVGFACRLLRKASRQGVRVLVTATDEVLAELDRSLWVFEARDFLPHVRMPGAKPAVAERTPVWLARDGALPGAPRLLLNLGAKSPEDVTALERLIEVVSADPEEAEQGRQRWRAYKAAGFRITHHAAEGIGRE